MSTPLESCLGISGRFEGGTGGPRYSLVSGNFDGQGISAGCLQWCAGQGSLQVLLQKTLGGYPVSDDQFAPIFALKDMKPAQAIPYAVATWGDPSGKGVTASARALWASLLTTPQCVQAQNDLAMAIMTGGLTEAAKFLPWRTDTQEHLRIAAFFFDLHVQQGSLSKKMHDGSHQPLPLTAASQADPHQAIAYARAQGKTKTADAWQAALDSGDDLTPVLLDYAFKRAALAPSTYMWDTLSRRGTIAARQGSVHGVWFDFTQILP